MWTINGAIEIFLLTYLLTYVGVLVLFCIRHQHAITVSHLLQCLQRPQASLKFYIQHAWKYDSTRQNDDHCYTHLLLSLCVAQWLSKDIFVEAEDINLSCFALLSHGECDPRCNLIIKLGAVFILDPTFRGNLTQKFIEKNSILQNGQSAKQPKNAIIFL